MASDAHERGKVTDLPWLTATEIAAAYARRDLSPVELVECLLDRITIWNPRFNAFITVAAQAALDEARQAEREMRAGRVRGPLHGVPVAIKDIIDIAGQATTCHSRLMAGHVAARDAMVVSQLRAAGAIVLGKLALHEFAIGGPSFDLPFPPARNPWNVDHQPGGSSSGAGAALAAGLVPVAVGTDTGGSVRNPAGHCGVVGIKPSYGLISRRGVFPLSFSLDHVGPMARSVADVALMLDILAGHDAEDPGSANVCNASFGADLKRGARGLRVGYVRHFHERDMPASGDVAAAIDGVARAFADLGAQVREVDLPSLQQFAAVQRIIFLAECWTVHARWLRERPGDYGEVSRRKLLPGAFVSAGDYIRAQQHRCLLIDAVDRVLVDVDVLLMANALEPACRIDDPAECVRTYSRHARGPANLTGHPAIAVPAGLSEGGLPLSVQLMGRAFDECSLLRAAEAYERVSPWHELRPPLLSGSL